MKKNFVVFSLLLVMSANIFAAAQVDLQGFTHIACELQPRIVHESADRHFTHPHIPFRQRTSLTESTSTNWAGYAALTNLTHPTAHTVSYVAGTWTVPTLSPLAGHTYCSMWVGVDGYDSNSVEQLGTEHDWVNGKQVNSAWFEMYPQYPYTINGFPANPGDSISASVVYQGNNIFVLTIINNTRKVYFVVPTSYTKSATAQRVSAEWVCEAPYSNQVLPLSNFGTVNFSNCVATINGVQGAINNSTWQADALTMVTSTGATKALVSGLSSNGENFSVTWKHQ